MKTLDIRKVPTPLLEYVLSLGEEPVILTLKKNKPVAVLLPVHDADLETVSLSLNPEFLALMEQSQRRLNKEGGLTIEEVRQRLGVPERPNQRSKSKNGKPGAGKTKPKNRNVTGEEDDGQV
jgi:hypothetical protein